jgi:hypothetical protein
MAPDPSVLGLVAAGQIAADGLSTLRFSGSFLD